jgi:class 3 adenylate cyclase
MITVSEEIIDKISESLYLMLNGKSVQEIVLPPDYPDNEIKQAISYLNRFILEFSEFGHAFSALSGGELGFIICRSKMSVIQSLKNLRSNLKHLTYKTQKITQGDFSQKVDFMGEFSEAFNQMTTQLEESFEQIETQNLDLRRSNDLITQEKTRSENLVRNILPYKIADDLKRFGRTEPEIFENVTVYFSDVVGFTKLSSTIEPKTLISELNEMFTVFDNIMENYHCERIKTIGDAYLAVCGMPVADKYHAQNMVNAALEIRDYISGEQKSDIDWKIRIGIHSGKVVGGVVGIKKYIYDIFGDTINTASRMESNSEPLKINVSEVTYNLLKNEFNFTERKPLEVKGKGVMKMYFVNSITESKFITTEKRQSPRIPVNTTINVLWDNISVFCNVVDLSTDGGALLKIKSGNKMPEISNLANQDVSIIIDPQYTKTTYSATIIRSFTELGNSYFSVKY